jgi:hypothetical protein
MGRDQFLTGTGTLMTLSRITSDFEALWVRCSSDSDAIEEFIAIGGSQLSVDGKTLVDSTDTAAQVSGKVGDGGTLAIYTVTLEQQAATIPAQK